MKTVGYCYPNPNVNVQCPANHDICVKEVEFQRRTLPSDGTCPDPDVDADNACEVQQGTVSMIGCSGGSCTTSPSAPTNPPACGGQQANYLQITYQCIPRKSNIDIPNKSVTLISSQATLLKISAEFNECSLHLPRRLFFP